MVVIVVDVDGTLVDSLNFYDRVCTILNKFLFGKVFCQKPSEYFSSESGELFAYYLPKRFIGLTSRFLEISFLLYLKTPFGKKLRKQLERSKQILRKLSKKGNTILILSYGSNWYLQNLFGDEFLKIGGIKDKLAFLKRLKKAASQIYVVDDCVRDLKGAKEEGIAIPIAVNREIDGIRCINSLAELEQLIYEVK